MICSFKFCALEKVLKKQMIRVVICEDQKKQLDEITSIVRKQIMIEDYDMDIVLATQKADDVIDIINNDDTSNFLFFLDVDLQSNISGIKLGSMIREKLPSAKIVFITTHSELAYMTFVYKVEAMDYIPKDDTTHFETRIRESVDTAYKRYMLEGQNRHQSVTVNVNDREIQLPVDKILFIESAYSPHKLAIHLENRIVEYYGKIKDVEDFNPYFVRSHQSYVVNIANVREIDKANRIAIMSDGEECLISVRYLKKVVEKMKEFGTNESS